MVGWCSMGTFNDPWRLGASSPHQLQFLAGTDVASVWHRRDVMRAGHRVIRSPQSLCSRLVMGGLPLVVGCKMLGGFKLWNIFKHLSEIHSYIYIFILCIVLLGHVDKDVDCFCDCWIAGLVDIWDEEEHKVLSQFCSQGPPCFFDKTVHLRNTGAIQCLTQAPHVVLSNLSSNLSQVVKVCWGLLAYFFSLKNVFDRCVD